jgi:hypothetical protein
LSTALISPIAFLDEIEELQVAVGVFLRDLDDRPRFASTISFLARRASRSPAAYLSEHNERARALTVVARPSMLALWI